MRDDLAIPGFAIAGAVVRKPYGQGAQRVYAGTVLTLEAFARIGHVVKRIWVRDGTVTPFYVPAHVSPDGASGHLIHRGGGRYDVIHGVQMNAEPLSREEAEALAQQPPVNA
jgi:hypothetical protein